MIHRPAVHSSCRPAQASSTAHLRRHHTSDTGLSRLPQPLYGPLPNFQLALEKCFREPKDPSSHLWGTTGSNPAPRATDKARWKPPLWLTQGHRAHRGTDPGPFFSSQLRAHTPKSQVSPWWSPWSKRKQRRRKRTAVRKRAPGLNLTLFVPGLPPQVAQDGWQGRRGGGGSVDSEKPSTLASFPDTSTKMTAALATTGAKQTLRHGGPRVQPPIGNLWFGQKWAPIMQENLRLRIGSFLYPRLQSKLAKGHTQEAI